MSPPNAVFFRRLYDTPNMRLYLLSQPTQTEDMTGNARKPGRRRATLSRNAIGLYDYVETPKPRKRRKSTADDLSDWRVVDDWPEEIPVTPEEADVIERWLGDVLEEMFGPKVGDKGKYCI